MSFLLTGTNRHPDNYTISIEVRGGPSLDSMASKRNLLGCVPVVSTFLGVGRVLTGAAYAIKHLAIAIFHQEKKEHLEKAFVGLKNIGIGALEVIPIIGNMAMLILINNKNDKCGKLAQDYFTAQGSLNNCAILFSDGKPAVQMPLDQYKQQIGKKTFPWKKVRIIKRNGEVIE